jgi:hypothetical protein
MTTTVANTPTIQHPRRRTLVSVGLVAVLALGAGTALGRVTSSDSSTNVPPKSANAARTTVDTGALWDELATMSAPERDIVVTGLDPSVRARLRAIGQELATVAAQ